ncbi:phosphate ABC transporter substrate-binding protein [Solibaculum mannosilyticum]|uniref:Phosphate-binding protein n=1 Tax=Solibaculum mannosilyticum TaxID=2780922 RepID=A0A7I8D358_9FIRM|nr:phosphate ABC transporter substrate-binding protein [Solibaculum mannosilyticum]BCI61246.1 phosphate-binding protein [Solibaculum mannosilyticum]CZT56000.1 Phosphate-binding protein PstS 1 precursor [Eubacteriaceae bacterium CHKCI005]
MKSSMIKRITAATIATFCLVVMGLSGCGSNNSSSTAAGSSKAADSSAAASAEDSSTSKELSGKISTGGSTSMEAVIGALQEAFAETYPDVDITYDPTGSGAGITGATEGSLDIGLSSRDLKEDETGVTGTKIALDGISIIVNKDNPITDLSLEDLARIATGEVKNWSELGGNDAEIVFVGREAGSGTRDGFESIVGVEDKCVYSEELTATGAVIAKVQSNPNAIGYASLSAVDESVKTLTIDKVAPSEETVQDGSYAIQRPFVFVTKDGAEQSDAVKTFIEFATSKDADELIRAAGAVPLA